MSKISLVTEEKQVNLLVNYNEGKKIHEKIPLLIRNEKTGWPLLQVSILSPSIQREDYYENSLGGGKCHYFFIGAFNFSSMLSSISGPVEINGNGTKINKKNIKADNVSLFLEGFKIFHKNLDISIIMTSNGYGKNLSIIYQNEESKELQYALLKSFDFALKKGAKIESFSDFHNNDFYSKEQIINDIDENKAVFFNGQIFVDFGELLKHYNISYDLISYFERIFKINEFLTMMKNVVNENDFSQEKEIINQKSHVSFFKKFEDKDVKETEGHDLSKEKDQGPPLDDDALLELEIEKLERMRFCRK